jgi:hypothetical protein
MKNIAIHLKRFVRSSLGIVILVTAGVAFLAFIEGLLYAPNLQVLVKMVGTFALLGMFLGVIYSTDPHEGFDVKASTLLRTGSYAIIGVIFAVVLHLTLIGSIICVAIFAILGWWGMRWAKYVDF